MLRACCQQMLRQLQADRAGNDSFGLHIWEMKFLESQKGGFIAVFPSRHGLTLEESHELNRGVRCPKTRYVKARTAGWTAK